MNGNKLKLTQYSDDVIRDLDIHVEYYIKYNIHLNNQQLFDEVNATREEYIQEIRACEAYNASFLRDEYREIDLPNEQIFKKFCFGIVIFKKIFENDMFSWRLFVTDKYLTRGQVACFQEILKFIPCHSIREIEDEDNDVFDIKPNITFARQSLEKLFSNIQIEEDDQMSKFCIELPFKVTNSSGLLDNLLNEDTNNFDIIRGPSEKLFCFDTISLTFLIRSIRPDAKYLFSSLSRLEIVTPGFWRSTFRPEVVLHVMVKSFEECCTNKIDFIDLAIRHPEQSRGFPNFQLKDDCDFPDLSSLVAQSEVKALTLTNFTENFQNYLQMFQNGHDDFNTNNNLWSKLVELNLNDSRIKLTDNSNNAFDPRLFEVLPKLEKLNVRINFRFCLDKKLFERASNLTYLAMMKNDIDYIKHDSFNGLVNLRILSLRATRIDFKAFTCLYKLEELTLRTYALETVDTTTFAGLTKLKVLDLKDCSINYVDPTAFDHMKELEILDLSYNYLEEIKFTNAAPGSIKFQGNSYLKLVQFDSSCVFKISEILLPYGCFSKSAKETGTFASLLPMDGLRKLTMTAMRTMPFNQCMNLNELILILTNFQVLEQGQLSCLSNLTKLKFHMGRSILDNQEIIQEEQIINYRIFNGLTSLKKLYIISNTCLRRIERDTFSLLPSLESLELRSCMIEFIEVGAFSCLPKLRKLDLDGNKLKHCPLLNELNSLERLSLNGNQIESIDGLFENMADLSINTKLRVLILNSNWLASLPAKAFSRLASLVTLDLNNNDLAVVSKDAFKGLFNLRALILSDIRSDAEFRIFDPELENLEVIDLRNSRFGIIKEKSKSWSFRNQVIVNAGELSDNPFVQNLAQANHIQIYPSYLKFDE